MAEFRRLLVAGDAVHATPVPHHCTHSCLLVIVQQKATLWLAIWVDSVWCAASIHTCSCPALLPPRGSMYTAINAAAVTS